MSARRRKGAWPNSPLPGHPQVLSAVKVFCKANYIRDGMQPRKVVKILHEYLNVVSLQTLKICKGEDMKARPIPFLFAPSSASKTEDLWKSIAPAHAASTSMRVLTLDGHTSDMSEKKGKDVFHTDREYIQESLSQVHVHTPLGLVQTPSKMDRASKVRVVHDEIQPVVTKPAVPQQKLTKWVSLLKCVFLNELVHQRIQARIMRTWTLLPVGSDPETYWTVACLEIRVGVNEKQDIDFILEISSTERQTNSTFEQWLTLVSQLHQLCQNGSSSSLMENMVISATLWRHRY